MRKLVTFCLLLAFWLALSGHYTPFLISCGIAVSVLGVWIAERIGGNDDEGMPLQVFANIPAYYSWLVVEIAKSAWAVTRIVLHPRIPVSPVMTVAKASQKTTTGVATYANSITLTPGTVTTGVKGKMLTVYALTRAGADDIEAGGMDARVRRFEGGT
jgi:multicomponent Na+:H+ antiporter subunit E